MNFYRFKSSTGEWICGDLTYQDEEEHTFILSKPRALFFTPAENGGMNIQLIPYDPVDPEASVEFSGDHVVAHSKSHNELVENAYIESTTDIQIAKAH